MTNDKFHLLENKVYARRSVSHFRDECSLSAQEEVGILFIYFDFIVREGLAL